METLSSSSPKARKEHKCDYCSGIILKGEVYSSQTNKYDEIIYTWKSHFRCNEIASELRMYESSDEGVTGEDFYEYIKEEYHNLQTDEDFPVPDFFGMLDYVCEKRLIKKQKNGK